MACDGGLGTGFPAAISLKEELNEPFAGAKVGCAQLFDCCSQIDKPDLRGKIEDAQSPLHANTASLSFSARRAVVGQESIRPGFFGESDRFAFSQSKVGG
jgi:hypothetical protein